MEILRASNANDAQEELEDVAQDVALRRITSSCREPSEARRKQGFGEGSAKRHAPDGQRLLCNAVGVSQASGDNGDTAPGSLAR